MENRSDIKFNVGAVRPVECVKQGWAIIKDQYWLIFAICFVGLIIASVVPFGILLGPMLCGIFICLLQKLGGRQTTFEMLFKGFDFFMPSFIATLFLLVPAIVLGVIAYVPLIIMQFRMMNNPIPDPSDLITYFAFFGVAMIVMALVLGTIHALLLFAYPLIAEHKISGLEAFKLSYRAVLKNLSGIGGLLGLHIGMIFVGYLLCFVGVYLMLPIILASCAVAYRQIFPAANRETYNSPPSPDAYRGAGSYN